jgi:hypothetical protein
MGGCLCVCLCVSVRRELMFCLTLEMFFGDALEGRVWRVCVSCICVGLLPCINSIMANKHTPLKGSCGVLSTQSTPSLNVLFSSCLGGRCVCSMTSSLPSLLISNVRLRVSSKF